MKKIFYTIIAAVLISACDITTENRTNINSTESSEVKKEFDADIQLLMHSRQAIRIEYNVDKQELILWISPNPETSISDNDRNFSNRDDHTCLFDKIKFPNLKLEDYVGVDYDPFHSVVKFKKQKLHIASLFDKPVVMVWSESPEIIDIKSDKADKAYSRTDKVFSIIHPDRGYNFNFVAAVADTVSRIQQQLQIDNGRSIYARVHLGANQPLFIAGALQEDYIGYKVNVWMQRSIEEHLAETEKQVDKIAKMGRIIVKDNPDLQKLLDMNKRAYISMQDASGAIRAAIKEIYYLIWVRDGGMSSPYLGYSGWTETLDKWTRFQLNNPTVIYTEEPKGRFFGQLVNGNITKWEEDGLFYALWSGFTHWTQTGSNEFREWKYLNLYENATDWLERYCYDDEMKAFGRYHYCESPLTDSRGNGWDNAVGNPTDERETKYEGKVIVRSYDLYINMLAYSSYIMLASMEYDPKSSIYLQKAKDLEPFLKSLFHGNNLPDYGVLLTKDGQKLKAGPYGMDETDYVWALNLPLFYPEFANMDSIRQKLFDNTMADPKGDFFAAYFSLIAGMDVDKFDEDTMMYAVNYAAKQCYEPRKYLPMAYTMVEMSDQPDGHPYHDIRPQGFTIGSWIAAMSNFGVKRDAFGFSVRATKYLDKIENYHYKNSVIDIKWVGEGSIYKVRLNGREILKTWQIPESSLMTDDNEIIVEMTNDASVDNTLISSTVNLISSDYVDNRLQYKASGYGINKLVFKNLTKNVSVFNLYNQAVEITKTVKGENTIISFEGKSIFKIILE